jgi:hypothetical protein
VSGSTATAAVHELVELSHVLVRSVQEHDVPRLDDLLADEFTLLGAAGELDRTGLLEAAAGSYEIDDFAYREIDPEIYGNTAVLVSRYRQDGRFHGRDVSRDLHVTDVWVRREGRWQIVRRHASVAA